MAAVEPNALPSHSSTPAQSSEQAAILLPHCVAPGQPVLAPQRQGERGCSSSQSCGSGLAAAGSPPQLRVRVPSSAQAGGKVSVEVGGQTLLLTLPGCARPGDALRLTRGADGNWQCELEEEHCRPEACRDSEEDELFCRVPVDAEPGLTRLRLAVNKDRSLVLTVPDNALPGDELALRHEQGTWRMRIVRDHEGPCRQRGVTLCKIQGDAHQLYADMVRAATDAGAWVSPKLGRGAAPPLNITGMVTNAHLEKGEEITRIPAAQHISTQRCSEVMPALFDAVLSLGPVLGGRDREAAHAACVARLLQEASARLEAKADPSRHTEAGLFDVPPLWHAYAETLLCETWSSHPYFRCIEDPCWVEELMEPSNEHKYLNMMAGDVVAMHAALVEHLSPEVLGPNFTLGFFLQARLAILSRIFQLDGDSALVPINDCVNHSVDAGVTWVWENGDMVLSARRDHEPGDEIHISYGRRSNVLLFRTYGFTLPPEIEPTWTYIAQGRPLPPYRRRLPQRLALLAIHFESHIVQDSLIAALNACRDVGQCPEAFLRELCCHCMEPYERCESLRPALAALGRVRRADPSSAAWWREWEPPEEARGEWEEHVLRVKMSEYLCLTAHLELLDVLEGRLSEEQCLAGSSTMREVLLEGFKILRTGGCFTCELDSALPKSMINGLT